MIIFLILISFLTLFLQLLINEKKKINILFYIKKKLNMHFN